jgi:EpsI family protein
MKKALVPAMLAAVLMASAAAVATVMTPTQKIVDTLPKLDLESAIPESFGEWTLDKRAVGSVVNPQQTQLLDRLYSQILTRTYYNEKGYRIMLSIAYGEDQRDGNQLHYPEVCYPAQGFQVNSNRKGVLPTALGDIPVRRLQTVLAGQRFEPVTYWTTVGSTALTGGTDKKLAEIRYGLQGTVPDGLLFRVSSIDKDSTKAFDIQSAFVEQLVGQIPAEARTRITGL